MSQNILTDYDKLDRTYRLYHTWITEDNFYSSFEVEVEYPYHKLRDGHILFQYWYGSQQLNVEVLVRKLSGSDRLEILAGSWYAGNFNFYNPNPPVEVGSVSEGKSCRVQLGLYNSVASNFLLTVNGRELVRSVKNIPYGPVVFGYEVQIDLPENLNIPLNGLPKLTDLPTPSYVRWSINRPAMYKEFKSVTKINASSNHLSNPEKIVRLGDLTEGFKQIILPVLNRENVVNSLPLKPLEPIGVTTDPVKPPTDFASDYNKKLDSPASLLLKEQLGLTSTSFEDLELSVDDVPTASTIRVPGLLSKEDLKLVTKALVEFFVKRVKSSDKIEINKCFIGFLQLAVLNSSTLEATLRTDNTVTFNDGFTIPFNYKEVCDVIKSKLDEKTYPNATRCFLRHCSNLCTTLLAKGKIKHNVKLVAKYGIPERFYPYCFDFSMVNTVEHGIDAVVANLLAKIIALKQPNSKTKKIHNALEVIDKVSAILI
ncbi:coat protein [Yam asymptomatic virus 1]|uniref:Coat protein n=1 Tax=Yam asymptomatic virus 1 TaxID=2771210 RepID=A0A7H1JMH4_9CLOS|nr:coat protein [Yam asymptomatic virus 1]QNT12721.1 coat protein [Yam asymptomatic virus 1]